MARPKQTKAYKKVRIKSAKELVIKNFGPDVFALLKKRYAMYRGKDDIQATVYKFLVDNKYSYREISALTGKTTVFEKLQKIHRGDPKIVFITDFLSVKNFLITFSSAGSKFFK